MVTQEKRPKTKLFKNTLKKLHEGQLISLELSQKIPGGTKCFIIPLGGLVAGEDKPKKWLIKVDGIDEPFIIPRH